MLIRVEHGRAGPRVVYGGGGQKVLKPAANTMLITISFAFPCHPFDTLIRFPCDGGGWGTAIASLSQP